MQVAASGLTAVLAVAFDHEGRMYALETDTVAGRPGPAAAGSGMVVRVNGDGSLTTIASGLVFPTAMTVGPDDALYVSNFGFGVPVTGIGQVVRIDLPSASSGQAAAAALPSGNGTDFSPAGADHGFSPPPRRGSDSPVAVVPLDLSSASSGQAAAALLPGDGTDFSSAGADHGFTPPPRRGSDSPVAVVPPAPVTPPGAAAQHATDLLFARAGHASHPDDALESLDPWAAGLEGSGLV
jgi:hypothetical protein